MRVSASFESLRTGISRHKSAANSNWVVFIWLFLLAYITTSAILVAINTEVSGIRTLMRRRNRQPEVNLVQRYLHAASNCFHAQETESNAMIQRLLDSGIRIPQNDAQSYDVCPVILSTVNRAVPHWIWTIASLYKGFFNETEEKLLAKFSPPTLLWRRGAAFDRVPELAKTRINEMVERGLVRPLLGKIQKYMPYSNKFKHLLIAQKWQEAQHFAKQAFDHVYAMEDCHKRGCRYCLILEDDIVISSNWRKRISNAISFQETTWGILKLFEVDNAIRLANPVQGWEIEDVPNIIKGGVFGGTIVALFLNKTLSGKMRVSLSAWKKLALWIGFIVWALILIAINGHDTFYRDAFDAITEHRDEPISFRRALFPTRGAVANMYKDQDIPRLTAAIKDLIWYTTDTLSLPVDDPRTVEARRFLSHFTFSTDPLRIDVIVAKYFMDQRKPILILEPNVVQHIGFISTEPLNKTPFTAMTATFEDGKVA